MSDKNPETFVNRIAREISDFGKIFGQSWRNAFYVILVGIACGATLYAGAFTTILSWFRTDQTVSVSSKEQPQQPAAPDSSPPKGSASNSQTSGALAIQNGELLVMRSAVGMAVLDMSFNDHCEASYRWRFKPVKGGAELTGSASLFEQYGVGKNPNYVTDLAGRLAVVAGPLETTWSCNSSNSGWIYPTEGLEIYAVKKIPFSKFRL